MNIDALIDSLLNKNQAKFIKMVRRAGVTLKGSSLFSDEDILETAKEEAFPKIILRIAGLKDKEGNPIFQGIGSYIDYEGQYANIVRLITSLPYERGILRVAGMFTASTLLRNIPLNSDLRFLDSCNDLEKQGIADLDTIVGSLIANPEVLLNYGDQIDLVKAKFFFAYNLDLTTIPSFMFDAVTGDSAISDKVVTLKELRVPAAYKTYVWYYLTSIDSTSYKEGLLEIFDGMTLDQLTQDLALAINDCSIALNTGLLASPSKEPIKEIYNAYKKYELYPESIDNRDKIIQFTLFPEIYSIELANRNPSAEVLREMISIRTFQLPTELTIGKTSTEILKLRSLSTIYFDLKYGKAEQYKSLNYSGPQSSILKIENIAGGKSTNAIEDSNFLLDSFYFKGDVTNYSGLLKIRVSTDREGLLDQWEVAIQDNDLSSAINIIFDSFYSRIETTGILLSAVKPNCLQVVPITTLEESTKIVIDILNIPPNMSIATGNPEKQLTPYNPHYSSINLLVIRKKECCDGSQSDSNNKAGKKIKPINLGRSRLLQQTLDKLESLNTCRWTL
jgi:hypothetical protein